MLHRVLEREVVLTPRIALLSIIFDVGGPKGERTFVRMPTMIAKWNIAKFWMSKQPPSLKKWRTGMGWASNIEEHVYLV